MALLLLSSQLIGRIGMRGRAAECRLVDGIAGPLQYCTRIEVVDRFVPHAKRF